ncbi:MAG: flagellar hook-basal body complex protein FliE [Treponema sp.]|nr:flagellar hook-basal body complex protein FliE [Treponema sp.]
MDITIGTLELNRTNPAHVGTRALIDTSKKLQMDSFGNVTDTDAQPGKVKKSFESYLIDAVSEMNDQQVQLTAIQEKVVTDPDSVNIEEVTTAMAKAQMSLNLAQTVIDRLISGWNELSQNR